MTDVPFTFDGCDSPSACRDGIRPLLAAGKDWSEVHCGRCGRQGIVRHADLLDQPAVNPAPAEPESEVAPLAVVEPAPEPVAETAPEPEGEARSAKGGKS